MIDSTPHSSKEFRMTRFALVAVMLTLSACGESPESRVLGNAVEDLQELALRDDTAWQLLESLTTEIGPRMGGSEGDAKAVAWARDNMNRLGFDRVWLEFVEFPKWVRNSESGSLLGDKAQVFDLTALGGSPGTDGALQGEVVHFENLEALEAAAPESVTGKIAFISERMERHQSGMGYATVKQRSRGPYVAARKGAVALLIRSVGTDYDGVPHTGMISGTEEGEPVPSAALSHPSADLLAEALEIGAPVIVEMNLDCGFDGRAVSQNVIGEFDGSANNGEFVVVGGHLDSWDLGEGAIDDGTGVSITMAAAKLVADQPVRPARGIRVVLFANEEQGVYGGKAYAQAHADELDTHIIGAESDLGSGRIYQFKSTVSEESAPLLEQLAELFSPLKISYNAEQAASGGADIGQMRNLGMPVIDLNHDASLYFDLHHTRNDRLDQVDPADIRFNVAAYVTFIQWAASTDAVFGPVPTIE
ncbi:MAG: carboxypeptidase Q [Rhodothermales bacterium]